MNLDIIRPEIERYLDDIGAFTIKMKDGQLCDYIVCYRGRFLMIKIAPQNFGTMIDKILQKFERAGGMFCVVYTIDDLKDYIQEVKNGKAGHITDKA